MKQQNILINKMNPRIRKKDKDKEGRYRHILEWEQDGDTKTKVLNPKKLLMDFLEKSKNNKEEQDNIRT